MRNSRKLKDAAPEKCPSVKPKKKTSISLFKSKRFKHNSIPTGVKGLRVLAEKTQAFDCDFYS